MTLPTGLSMFDTAMPATIDDDDLLGIISSVWSARTDRYSEERAGILEANPSGRTRDRIEMYQVGG